MNIDYCYIRPAQKHEKLKWKATATWVGLFAIVLIFAGHTCSSKEPQPALKNCHSNVTSFRQLQMTEYFRDANNKHPEMMATAVLETKRPKLMAAIAVAGEKNSPFTVKQGGYKKRHVGAWQVSKRDWGYAGATPIDQALKAERVLDDLLEECNGDLRKALNRYGGDRTRKVYAKNILNEVKNIP